MSVPDEIPVLPGRFELLDLCRDLVTYGIRTARHAQDCAAHKLNPRPGESTDCTCGLEKIRATVQGVLG